MASKVIDDVFTSAQCYNGLRKVKIEKDEILKTELSLNFDLFALASARTQFYFFLEGSEKKGYHAGTRANYVDFALRLP